ncbi:C4-dicarboxylate ABC transporter substrate-binding protein [Paracoccus sp. S-4012]|uniref:TRAP transporter substrate-binding protein n=1 Tax=Paracoccus sp. S-4012 TaxID=2665648 RepID=UPI0012B00BE8|nr:TRAP transporter substrate-binding protein [Paracoccus sp. S-4012]MRX48999.1 C4-dicarboxylate ABC transporter substrate-binding protein [Paracoccus sp. S-4012]
MKTLIAAAAAALLTSGAASAQEVTLRLHHFLAPTAPVQTQIMEPWAAAVEEQSGGRIDVQIFPSMQLGGKPPQLYDQARDGVVDIAWTLLGYTPGRFPVAEVFELPFVASNAAATNMALQDFQAKYLADELGEVKPLLLHVPAPGKFHLKTHPVTGLADLAGMKIRAPSRTMTDTLNALGATAVGMPVPELPQALTTGVIDGALVPWEVTPSLRLSEITPYHTEFDGPHGMYTSVFALVMNQAKFDSLPDDLKQVIDDNSGTVLARKAAAVYDQIEADIRQDAIDAGAEVIVIPEADLQPWKDASQPVTDAWVAAMDKAGHDGAAMLQDARDMIAAHQAQ